MVFDFAYPRRAIGAVTGAGCGNIRRSLQT
jgi:hypothetical protein